MAIGKLAAHTGVKVPTIRYYEQIGLLPCPPRTDSNRRLYDEDALRRLRFIRHARDLGFEIDAIRGLLTLAAKPQASCEGADAIAVEHLADIDGKIARLTALRRELVRMIDQCSHGKVADCGVIDALAEHDGCTHQRH